MAFCRKLTEREKAAGRLPTGYEYTLPTEAQWEYACRAGTETALNNGKDLTSTNGSCRHLDEVAWYEENSGGKTHAVGGKKANAWGLHDMHGNVWEWCRDWYDDDYPTGAVEDPTGPRTGSDRVERGGGWRYSAGCCRAAFRNNFTPEIRNRFLGFRLALAPVNDGKQRDDGPQEGDRLVAAFGGTEFVVRNGLYLESGDAVVWGPLSRDELGHKIESGELSPVVDAPKLEGETWKLVELDWTDKHLPHVSIHDCKEVAKVGLDCGDGRRLCGFIYAEQGSCDQGRAHWRGESACPVNQVFCLAKWALFVKPGTNLVGVQKEIDKAFLSADS